MPAWLPVAHACTRAHGNRYWLAWCNAFPPPQARARRRTCEASKTLIPDAAQALRLVAQLVLLTLQCLGLSQGPMKGSWLWPHLVVCSHGSSLLTCFPKGCGLTLGSKGCGLTLGSPGLAEVVSRGRQRRRHAGDLNKSKHSKRKPY